jgi:4-amino-4-deoxy-L-arabinose transferase-like glycosyltransferase
LPVRLDKRKFLYVIGAITLVAWLLRLYVGWQLMDSDSAVERPHIQTDMATYFKNAKAVADGTYDYSEGFYYQPFYYTVFLPLTFKIFGAGAKGVVIVQSLLGAACVFLAGLSAAMLFGKRAGIVAAALLALARMHIFYTPYMLMAVLQSFWVVLLFYMSIIAWRRRQWWFWVVPGLVTGLSITTRGNMILFVPLIAILAGWSMRRRRALVVPTIAILLVSSYLPQLPFSIVNYKAHGRWVGASSAAASVLALGNTPESPPGGREPWMGAGPMEYPLSFGEWNRQASLPEPDCVTLLENTWRWFSREPLAYAELKWRMVLLFWNRIEVPNNVSLEGPGGPSGIFATLLLPVFTDFCLLGSLALGGMLMALMTLRHRALVVYGVAFVMLYSASIILFYVLARFRLPLVPVLCVFAGYPPALLWQHVRRRKKRKPDIWYVSAIVLATAFVCIGFDAYTSTYESTVIRLVRPNGVVVQLPDRIVLKDHGPLTFGQWGAGGGVAFDKTFVLPDDVELRSPQIRFAIMGAEKITIDGVETVAMADMQGINWVTYDLQPSNYDVAVDGKSVVVRVAASSSAQPPATVIVDFRRDYGRSRYSTTDEHGEVVAELILQR